MGDFQQLIDVVEVDLPELEDVSGYWVEDRKVDVVDRCSEDEIFFAVIGVLPRLLDHSLSHLSGGEVAVAARVAVVVIVRGWCLSYCAPEVAVFALALLI